MCSGALLETHLGRSEHTVATYGWFCHKWPVALPLADATLLPFPERRLPPQVSVGETARPQQKRH